jgi:hypothetical protein
MGLLSQVAIKDGNSVATAIFQSSTNASVVMCGQIDQITGRVLVDFSGVSGGTGTWYPVSGTVNSSNVTFTIPVAVTSNFLLQLGGQVQSLSISPNTYDYSYVVGVSTTTITMTIPPDISLASSPFQAYVVS